MSKEIDRLIAKSALTESNSYYDTTEVLSWLKAKGLEFQNNTKKTSLVDLQDWEYCKNDNILQHKSGKFFQIHGIRVHTNFGEVESWTQPIIDQPEIGILGIIAREINGTLHFLMQAKMEPGNLNGVQLSPTLQATRSNYTRVHGGKYPDYLEYFLGKRNRYVTLVDQLQSEHGSRFLHKRNRNTVILVEEEIQQHEDYRWLTLGQIKKLCNEDNLVNMDTRTVIAGLTFISERHMRVEDRDYFLGSTITKQFKRDLFWSAVGSLETIHSNREIASWFTELKCKYEMKVQRIPLSELELWNLEGDTIEHFESKYFRIIGVDVELSGREIEKWSQPLIESLGIGLCALIIKKVNGVYHFLIQGKVECGNLDALELAPTVQCTMEEVTKTTPPEYFDIIQNADVSQIRFDSHLSEEGGRFFQYQNRYVIVEVEETADIPHSNNFVWMSFQQILTLLQSSSVINIHTRSLIACFSFT